VGAERVFAYVDGFNLYFGLKSRGWRRYYWLNVARLASLLLKRGQQLLHTKYFTVRVTSPPEKRQRQATYLDALGTLDHFSIFYGKYQFNPRTCARCGAIDCVPNEKMTDVNIAVELFADAFGDSFDTALLISADSDLAPCVRKVRQVFPGKRVVAAFPPRRFSDDLRRTCHHAFTIGRRRIGQTMLPDEVRKPDGFVLRRPATWK
jgi:uncharacterized LabA/DUF88 family protein